ncbi:hypothetical protein [Burkholderia vietnamiensis]|uniref:hypothetical protein n=1 Tax=Burkholderia vietnamiensis TaxID=60552 RepID=UPI001CF19AAC|nr:hypothetical protein [Burkholderia vietnamiensis]MCA8448870.1 hypothetical protein [Burkholderia vietnamiensis]
MHPLALFVLLVSVAGLYACLNKLRRLRKQLYVMTFDRPAHATADEAWAWNAKHSSMRMSGFWTWMAMAPLVFVFFLALITMLTGATSA